MKKNVVYKKILMGLGLIGVIGVSTLPIISCGETKKDEIVTPEPPIKPEPPIPPEPPIDPTLDSSGGTTNGLSTDKYLKIIEKLQINNETAINNLTNESLNKILNTNNGFENINLKIKNGSNTSNGELLLEISGTYNSKPIKTTTITISNFNTIPNTSSIYIRTAINKDNINSKNFIENRQKDTTINTWNSKEQLLKYFQGDIGFSWSSPSDGTIENGFINILENNLVELTISNQNFNGQKWNISAYLNNFQYDETTSQWTPNKSSQALNIENFSIKINYINDVVKKYIENNIVEKPNLDNEKAFFASSYYAREKKGLNIIANTFFDYPSNVLNYYLPDFNGIKVDTLNHFSFNDETGVLRIGIMLDEGGTLPPGFSNFMVNKTITGLKQINSVWNEETGSRNTFEIQANNSFWTTNIIKDLNSANQDLKAMNIGEKKLLSPSLFKRSFNFKFNNELLFRTYLDSNQDSDATSALQTLKNMNGEIFLFPPKTGTPISLFDSLSGNRFSSWYENQSTLQNSNGILIEWINSNGISQDIGFTKTGTNTFVIDLVVDIEIGFGTSQFSTTIKNDEWVLTIP